MVSGLCLYADDAHRSCPVPTRCCVARQYRLWPWHRLCVVSFRDPEARRSAIPRLSYRDDGDTIGRA